MIHILNIGRFTFFYFTHINAIGINANLAIASAPSLFTSMLLSPNTRHALSSFRKITMIYILLTSTFSTRDLDLVFLPSPYLHGIMINVEHYKFSLGKYSNVSHHVFFNPSY